MRQKLTDLAAKLHLLRRYPLPAIIVETIACSQAALVEIAADVDALKAAAAAAAADTRRAS
jgi:hypothetical protein